MKACFHLFKKMRKSRKEKRKNREEAEGRKEEDRREEGRTKRDQEGASVSLQVAISGARLGEIGLLFKHWLEGCAIIVR